MQLYRFFLCHVVLSLQCQSLTENLQNKANQKILYFAKFRILQLALQSWFPILTRGLSSFVAVYYTIVSLLRQRFSESLESGLSSEKLVISHYTNFNRSLVYFPWIKSLTTLQLLRTFNGIKMTPAFLKKGSTNSILKKSLFCEISHFTIFPKYFCH